MCDIFATVWDINTL